MREKEEFIRDFNEAFTKNDLDFILNSMTEDIEWYFVGDQTRQGKEAVRAFMEPMSKVQTLEMELLQIVSDDQAAAVNGRMTIKEPSGEIKSFGFADFYQFSGFKSPKIKKMTSYVVPFHNKKSQA